MLKKTKLAVALVVALSAMGIAASSASAITASVSPAGTQNVTSSAVTFGGSGISIICELTLRTSLLGGPITVARGAQIGEVTEVRWANCSGGTVERVLSLNWRLTIGDTLPTVASLTTRNATGILLIIQGASFNLSAFGGFVNCLYRGNPGALMALTHTARESTTYTGSSLVALSEIRLPFVSGSGLCPRTGTFSGTFSIATQTITLA